MLQRPIASAGLTIKSNFLRGNCSKPFAMLKSFDSLQFWSIEINACMVDLLWSVAVASHRIPYVYVTLCQIFQMLLVGVSVNACTVSSNYNIGGLKSKSFPDGNLFLTSQKRCVKLIKSNFASAMKWIHLITSRVSSRIGSVCLASGSYSIGLL